VRQGIDHQPSGRWPTDDLETGTAYSPSRFDPVARAASAVIGGPAGRRLASGTGFWGAAPVLVLLAAAMLSFGVVQKEHCRAQGWSSPDQFWHACYSDIPVLYGSSSLGAETRRGLIDSLGQGGLGQPPVSGALMWITSALVPDSTSDAPRHFFDLSAVLLALVLTVAVAAVALALGRRSWDAAHLALSPVLITAGLISYELLAVAFLAAALLALSRGRPLIGGLLLGLGVASAPQVAVAGLVVALLAGRYLRLGTGAGIGATFAGSALGCWLIIRVLLLPGLTGQLGTAWKGWVEAVPGYGSIWLGPQLLGASEPDPANSLGGRTLQLLFSWIFRIGPLSGSTASVLSLLLLVILGAVILQLTLVADPPGEQPLSEPRFEEVPGSETDTRILDHRAPYDPTVDSTPPAPLGIGRFVTDKVAPLTLALMAALLFTAKSLPVQASLLLLPLIALSGLRWRDHLIWASTELVYFVGIWLYIGGETTANRGLPALFYLLMLAARLAGIAWVGVQGVLVFRSPSPALAQAVDKTLADPPAVDRFLSS